MPWVPPLEVALTWPPPNTVNPESRGPATMILNLVLAPIALIVVLIRVYTRVHLSDSFGADDCLIILSMFPAITFTVVSLYDLIALGLTLHVWDVPISTASLALKFVLTAEVCFIAACGLTKLSMLALIRRMTKQGKDVMSKVVWGTMIFVVVLMIIFLLTTIFQCQNVSDTWALNFTPGVCLNQTTLLLTAGIFNTITDFVVVLLPIPLVLRLSLPTRQQVVVIALFGAGFVVCIAGIVRTIYTYRATTSYDSSWDGYVVWLTGAIEMYIGILGASIPPTRPFFRRYLPRMVTKFSSVVKTDRATNRTGTIYHTEIDNEDRDVPLQPRGRAMDHKTYAHQDQFSTSSIGSRNYHVDNVVQSEADLEKETWRGRR